MQHDGNLQSVVSIKAIRYQIGDIYDALTEVAETAMDPKCRTEAQSFAKAATSYEFLVTIVGLI